MDKSTTVMVERIDGLKGRRGCDLGLGGGRKRTGLGDRKLCSWCGCFSEAAANKTRWKGACNGKSPRPRGEQPTKVVRWWWGRHRKSVTSLRGNSTPKNRKWRLSRGDQDEQV